VDDGDVAGAERQLPTADLQAELPLLDREPLALRRVDVRRRDEPVRLDDGLDHDRFAVRVARGGEEGDALAGDRVLDGVASADHFLPLSGSWLTTRMLLRRGSKIVGRAGDSRSER